MADSGKPYSGLSIMELRAMGQDMQHRLEEVVFLQFEQQDEMPEQEQHQSTTPFRSVRAKRHHRPRRRPSQCLRSGNITPRTENRRKARMPISSRGNPPGHEGTELPRAYMPAWRFWAMIVVILISALFLGLSNRFGVARLNDSTALITDSLMARAYMVGAIGGIPLLLHLDLPGDSLKVVANTPAKK